MVRSVVCIIFLWALILKHLLWDSNYLRHLRNPLTAHLGLPGPFFLQLISECIIVGSNMHKSLRAFEPQCNNWFSGESSLGVGAIGWKGTGGPGAQMLSASYRSHPSHRDRVCLSSEHHTYLFPHPDCTCNVTSRLTLLHMQCDQLPHPAAHAM